jgi:hypothetical protein
MLYILKIGNDRSYFRYNQVEYISILNNNKIVSTKKTNAIFLLVVLVTGTFAAIFPSSFIIRAKAQTAESEYAGYDNNEYGYNNNYNSE